MLEEVGMWISAWCARFAFVAARWALGAPHAAAMPGLEGDWAGRSLMEVVTALGSGGEASMRLACDVDALMPRLVSPQHIAHWLRTPGVGYEDELVTPLQALCTGPAALRALRRHLENLCRGH